MEKQHKTGKKTSINLSTRLGHLYVKTVRQDGISLEKKTAITLYNLCKHSCYCILFSWSSFSWTMPSFERKKRFQFVEFSISKHDVTEGTGHFLQKFGFPQVVGSIDGTQIPIKQPARMPMAIIPTRWAKQSIVKVFIWYIWKSHKWLGVYKMPALLPIVMYKIIILQKLQSFLQRYFTWIWLRPIIIFSKPGIFFLTLRYGGVWTLQNKWIIYF